MKIKEREERKEREEQKATVKGKATRAKHGGNPGIVDLYRAIRVKHRYHSYG